MLRVFIHPRNVSELVWEPHSLPGLCWQLQAAFTTQPRLQSAEPSSAALSCSQRGWGLSPPTFPPFLLPEMLCRICWGSPGCFLLVLLRFRGSPQVQLNSPEGQTDKRLGFCVHIPFWWLSAAEGPLRARKGPAAPPQLSLRCFKLGGTFCLCCQSGKDVHGIHGVSLSAQVLAGKELAKKQAQLDCWSPGSQCSSGTGTPCPGVNPGIGAQPWPSTGSAEFPLLLPPLLLSVLFISAIPALPLRPCWEGSKNQN